MFSVLAIFCLSTLWTASSTGHVIPLERINWVDCSKSAPDFPGVLNLTGVDLTRLPSTLHCGQIVVPMDYDKPLCADNNITLGFTMHRPVNPKGVIFYNGGGTDANAVVAWLVALKQTTSFDDLLDYDLMFLDIRGTYSSNPLNVGADGFAAADFLTGPFPTTEAEFNATRAASARFIQSWVDSSTPPGIVQYVGAKEAVQDYEEIRQALGYERINFIGSSYGSFRAVLYASMFHKRVGNFVLDAVAPHGLNTFDKTLDVISALDRAVLRIDAYCHNNSTCPWQVNGTGIIPEILQAVLASATENPLPITTCVLAIPCNMNTTAQNIREDLYGYLQEPDYPTILEAIGIAAEGDGSLFPGFHQSDSTALVSIPLECKDYNYQATTFADWQKLLNAVVAKDTSKSNYNLQMQLQLGCLAWPYDSNEDKILKIHHRMLLVTADFDPYAPFEWATFTWRSAPNSALAVRHGDDHTSFSLVSQPVGPIIRDFLKTGKLPKASIGDLVSVYTPGMKAPEVADPYNVGTGAQAGDQDSGSVGNITVETFLP